MEKLKSLNLKIKIKGLDEFREDIDQMELVVDVDRDGKDFDR